MASNQTTCNDSSGSNTPASPKEQHREKILKKTVVAYRPASKAKKSSSKSNLFGKGFSKSPEDMHEELLHLRKSLASITDENSLLKAKVRRIEEENTKKDKQILQYLDPEQNEELRRILVDKKSSANVTINNLKQRIIRLELSLKEKEQTLKKLQADLKSTKVKEMKIQMDTYYQEINRLKSVNQKKTPSSSSRNRKEAAEELESDKNYIDMSKEQLVEIISTLEKKPPPKRPETARVDMKNLSLDKKRLEEKLKTQTELAQRYQKLAEAKDAEVKSLRSQLSSLQCLKPSQRELHIRTTGSQPLQTQQDTTDNSSSRGTSAPITRAFSKSNDPIVMSSTVRKAAQTKGLDIRKAGSSSVSSPRRKGAEKMESPRLTGKRSLNKLELDLSKVTPSNDSRRTLSARSSTRTSVTTIPSSNQTSVPTDTEQWVMQATVKKASDSKRSSHNTTIAESPQPTVNVASPPCKNPAESPQPTVKVATPPCKSPATIAIAQSPEENQEESKGGGDSSQVVDFQVVEDFRQNVAAKKIQKQWKRHQKEVDETRQKKLDDIRSNSAARKIQHGWKKHQSQKVTQPIEMNPIDHNDDDDVVC